MVAKIKITKLQEHFGHYHLVLQTPVSKEYLRERLIELFQAFQKEEVTANLTLVLIDTPVYSRKNPVAIPVNTVGDLDELKRQIVDITENAYDEFSAKLAKDLSPFAAHFNTEVSEIWFKCILTNYAKGHNVVKKEIESTIFTVDNNPLNSNTPEVYVPNLIQQTIIQLNLQRKLNLRRDILKYRLSNLMSIDEFLETVTSPVYVNIDLTQLTAEIESNKKRQHEKIKTQKNLEKDNKPVNPVKSNEKSEMFFYNLINNQKKT